MYVYMNVSVCVYDCAKPQIATTFVLKNFFIKIRFSIYLTIRNCRYVNLYLQPFAKYLRRTLVFMRNSALREKLSSIFQEFFASISKISILAGRLGTGLSSYGVLTLSWYFLISEDAKSKVVRQLVRKLVYTMFISNNRASFHLRWKENFLKQPSLKILWKWLQFMKSSTVVGRKLWQCEKYWQAQISQLRTEYF